MTIAEASSSIEEAAGGIALGADLATIFAPVPLNADLTPRVFASATAIEQRHGYASGVDHAAIFIQLTKLPIYFVPMPIGTEGTVGQLNMSGNTGTSTVSIAPDTGGSLERVQGITKILRGGVVGTDEIWIENSLDGARTSPTKARVGTASSYTIPRIGQVLSFSPGTLVKGETVLTWVSTGPELDDADLDTARQNLAKERRQSRSWLMVKELSKEADVAAYQLAVAAYDTDDKRPLQGMCYQRPNHAAANGDRARMSHVRSWMIGSPSVEFVQVGPPGDTATRDAGSFEDNGFVDGDFVTITGTSDNDATALITDATGAILTFGPHGVTAETADASIFAAPGLEFVDGAAGDDTLVRNRGPSWLHDGFETGHTFTVSGTVSNDGDYLITGVTDDTITVATDSFTAEAISSWSVQVFVTVSYTVDFQAQDTEFAPVSDDYRLEIAYGWAWWPSPTLDGARIRRPAALADLARGFQIDLSLATWDKNLGALGLAGTGPKWGNTDAGGMNVEYDDRVYELGNDGDFTTLRTWASDSSGQPYVSGSRTRNRSGGVLDETPYARVGNVARKVAVSVTENFTGGMFDTQTTTEGKFLTGKSRGQLNTRVNEALSDALLKKSRNNEGPRAESAVYAVSTTDNLAPSAGTPTITGVIELVVRGLVFRVITVVRIS